MKITDVTLQNFLWKRDKSIRNGKYTYTNISMNLINIHTDEGITGIGWGLSSSSSMMTVAKGLLDYFKPLLIGKDPFNYRRIWNELWQPKLVGRRGITTRFISWIDIAVWDVLGKKTGKSLHKLLGGFHDRVPAYIAGGYYAEGKGLDGLVSEMEENISLGAKAIKMKIGGVSIREDLERIKVVRETIGEDVKLMVDANCAYSVSEAIKIAKKMERYDVFWFEEPISVDNYRGHQRLAQSTTIPIATGENEYTRYGFRDLIAYNAAEIYNADAQILGGITEFMQVAALIATYDLHIAPHGDQEIHIHLVGAIPHGLIVEFYRETVDENRGNLFEEKMQLNHDGFITIPERPGLGVTPNYDFLKKYSV